jgi:tetratricopeptide (TPR) repeat protein
MFRRHVPPLLLLLTLAIAGCQTSTGEPPAPAATAPTRSQSWTICQDPNRGMAAANACTEIIQAGQESPRSLTFVHYNRGLALSRRGRTQAAIDDFDAALALDPQFALALYQRGTAYRQLGQNIRAEQDLLRARQLDSRLQ